MHWVQIHCWWSVMVDFYCFPLKTIVRLFIFAIPFLQRTLSLNTFIGSSSWTTFPIVLSIYLKAGRLYVHTPIAQFRLTWPQLWTKSLYDMPFYLTSWCHIFLYPPVQTETLLVTSGYFLSRLSGFQVWWGCPPSQFLTSCDIWPPTLGQLF